MTNQKKTPPVEQTPPQEGDIKAENARLKLELENAQLQLELAQVRLELAEQKGGTFGNPFPPLDEIPTDTVPRPFGPGGAPVPRAPITPVTPKGSPKQGDIVNMTCRSGAIIRATGQKCEGRQAKLEGVISNSDGLSGAGGRRVIYTCTTCGQPWHVVY